MGIGKIFTMLVNRDFVEYVLKHANGKKNTVYASALFSGVCVAVLMYSLVLGLQSFTESEQVSLRACLMFASALAAFYFTQKLGGTIVSTAVLKGLGELELSVMDKLRRSSYAAKNGMDAELIYAAVGGDKAGVVAAARFLIPNLSSVIVVVLAGVYLATVSIQGALLVAVLLYGLIRLYGDVILKKVNKRRIEDSQAVDRFTVSLKDIIEGFNELKMNRRKSEALFNEKIAPASAKKNERLLVSELQLLGTVVLQQAVVYLPLGLILFLLPSFSETSAQDLMKLVSVTLMVTGPALSIVASGPTTTAAADMIKRLQDLEELFSRSDLESIIEKDEEMPTAPDFKLLECANIVFEYAKRANDEKAFSIHVDKFHIKKGEFVIARGGNGSGKTTFMRVLAGLEKPTSGNIEVDGVRIGEADYRAMFSIVMTDFHLFDRFYGNGDVDAAQFRKWRDILRLDEKVQNYKDELPTVNLSSGQKKRMALLTAVLENRRIMLLDEVAADFDPEMRERFYREILPALKSEGRTLFVISHDDRYYDIADRIIEFREGTIVS
ncbi:MAG: ATP-binding cassette domain-containing protein [Chitinispirillales bacterium]|jgi:putative ATP-binding cassette transporter|nr:ATP-binding cassette domain-containing protein [Chitinispirillales bacterium]